MLFSRQSCELLLSSFDLNVICQGFRVNVALVVLINLVLIVRDVVFVLLLRAVAAVVPVVVIILNDFIVIRWHDVLA